MHSAVNYRSDIIPGKRNVKRQSRVREGGPAVLLAAWPKGGTTKVNISIYNESLERLERMIEGGFREGAMMQLQNLEELLANLHNREPGT